VPWDTRLFGFPVFSLESWQISEDSRDLASRGWHLSALHAIGSQRVLLTGRVPANEDALRGVLNLLPMAIVEWTLHPVLDLGSFELSTDSKVQIRVASGEDRQWLRSQARGAFEMSRFFRDPFVPKEVAAGRFESWVDAALEDPAKEVFLFENESEETLGFFVVSSSQGIAHLELTAIADSKRGQGWSLAVWEAFLLRAKTSGLRSVTTNISAENSAVVGIYPKLGFRFGQSSVAMHGHFNNH